MNDPREVRSIWQNIKIIVQGMADALSNTTQAVGTTAAIGNSLANAGLIMAESNEELVKLDTKGDHQDKLQELYSKYPTLKPTTTKARVSK